MVSHIWERVQRFAIVAQPMHGDGRATTPLRTPP